MPGFSWWSSGYELPVQGTQDQSVVGELRLHKPCSSVRGKKNQGIWQVEVMCDDGGGTDEAIRVVMELVVVVSDVLLMEVEAKVVLEVFVLALVVVMVMMTVMRMVEVVLEVVVMVVATA